MSLYDLDKGPFVLVIILVFFAFTIICLGEVWDQDVYSRNEWKNCRDSESMSNFLFLNQFGVSVLMPFSLFNVLQTLLEIRTAFEYRKRPTPTY